MNKPKHVKITDYKKLEDGSIQIDTKSYFEDLTMDVREYEKNLMSSYYTLKKDVEEALKHVIDDGSPKLVLTIKANSKGGVRIVKRWVEITKNYPRR